MITDEQLSDIVLPVVLEQGAELYDLENLGDTLRVLVDKPGGIDIDTLGVLSRAVSNVLEGVDALGDGFSLEVSSPGVERPLRLHRHFDSVVGQRIKVKTLAGTAGPRRIDGVLLSADENGCSIETLDGSQLVGYEAIERANVVFDWGSTEATRVGSKSGGSKTRKVAKT